MLLVSHLYSHTLFKLHLLLFSSLNLNLAITCVDGNTTVDNVVKNVAILTGAAKKDIPIYEGVNGPIVKAKKDASAYHGTDGFGGKQEQWMHIAAMQNVKKEHAVNAIIKHVNEEHEKGNEVGVFTVGPMTNLAMAVRMDPSIITKIKHVYVMGGTVNGWGNMTLTGEFNFWVIQKQQRFVLLALRWPISFLGKLHSTSKSLMMVRLFTNTELIHLDKKRLLRRDNDAAKVFWDINQFNETTVDAKIYCCDGLCIAAAIDPSVVTKSHTAYGEVMTEGEKTAGGIFYNMYTDFVEDNSVPNVYQMNEIDHDIYIDMLEASLGLEKL